MNDRYFDLGNLSVNNGFDDEHDRALLELYFDEPVTDARFASLQLLPHRVGLPRGDVGRRAAAPLRARLRLRRLRDEHFAAARAGRGRSARGGVAGALPRPRELPDRARVVIVGGGVGGTSIAYHLAQLGERDVVLVDRAELTSGSTFHSAGLVGQLRGSVSLTRMMMDSVELYRRLGDACGWVECGGLRLACTPEREEELHRQVGWSRTFGLPLELLSADEAAALFPLMSTDGVRGGVLPADRRLPRPLAADLRAGRGRARGRLPDLHPHARDGHRRRATGACAACRPSGGRSRPRSSSTPAGCSPPRSGAWPACASRSCPSRTSTSSPSPSASATTATCRRCATPTCSSTTARRAAGWSWGGYERHSAPWSLRPDGLDAIAPDFNGILLEEDWDRFEEIAVNSRKRVPAMEDVQGHAAHQRARGASRPTTSSCWARARCAGFFVAAGFCAHGLAGAGGLGKAMAEWIVGRRAGDGPVGDGRAALRRALPLAELHAQAHARGLRDLLRHQVPRPRARGRPPAAGVERLRLAPRPRRGLRREVGLGARELVRVQRGRGRRGAAPARLGGPAVVAGDRRRARRLPRARGALRRVLVRQDRGGRPGRRRRTWSGCATTASRAASARSPTRRCSTRAAGSSATSPSRAWRRSSSRSSPAPRSATTTCRGSAATRRTTARCASAT